MAKRISWILAAACGLGALPASAQDAKPAPLKIGVVNLRVCFDKDKYERMKQVGDDLTKKGEEIKKEMDKLEKTISGLREMLGGLPTKGTSLHNKKSLDLAMAETQYKITYEQEMKKLKDYVSDVKLEIYNEIRNVVNAIAQEQKFDLVFRVEQPQLDEKDERNLSLEMASRVVLYHRDSFDITPLVVDRLNQEWKKKQAAATAEWECAECKVKNKEDKCSKCGKKKP